MFSSPHGDFSFSIEIHKAYPGTENWFSSPHGDFSFSIKLKDGTIDYLIVFVPSRGFLFFYFADITTEDLQKVFVPSRGFLFFYSGRAAEIQI